MTSMDENVLELTKMVTTLAAKVDRLSDTIAHVREIQTQQIAALQESLSQSIQHGDDNVKQSLELLANLMAERVKGVDNNFHSVNERMERLEQNQRDQGVGMKELAGVVTGLQLGAARIAGYLAGAGASGGVVAFGLSKVVG